MNQVTGKWLLLFLLSISGLVPILQAQSNVLSNPSSCNLNLEIEDNQCPDGSPFNNPNQFIINVQNAPGTQLGVDVYLKEVRLLITHEWSGDIEVSLTSPGGKKILITDDNGGNTDNYGSPLVTNCRGTVNFALDACVSITDNENANPPFIDQPYLPMESFLIFNDSHSNPNGNWILSICDDVEQDTGQLQFVELVFAPLTCLPVTQVDILEQDSTSIFLDWAPALDCGNVITYIEYGPPGFTPGSNTNPGVNGTVLLASCPPFLLTGLDPETDYDLYIRKRCPGSSGFSGNSCGLFFKTGCLPAAPTTTETFDEESLCSTRCERACELIGTWQNTTQDGLDWIAYSDPTPTQGTGPNAGFGGTGNYLYLESSGNDCPEGSQAILQSNCFELQKQGTDSCHFSFYYFMSGFNVGSLSVELSADGGISWEEIWALNGQQDNRWTKTYLSLNQYPDGQIIQLRLIGTKGNGPQGDIAIDHISFHGSIPLGPPDQVFYADQDQDGFGDPANFLNSCLSTPPPGYVTISGDCNDQNPMINPDAPEIPCDNLDNNCNGFTDDLDLPVPTVTNDTICSGETPFLTANPVSGKFIFWYTTPEGQDEIPEFGSLYSPSLPPNEGSSPQVYRFYAEESDLICRSTSRAEAIIVVNPRPQGSLPTSIEICEGDRIDLANVGLIDQNQTGSSLQFYDQLPLIPENELQDSEVSPIGSSTYFYQFSSPEGCTGEGSIPITQRERPQITFPGGNDLSLCLESSRLVEAQVTGGEAPYQFSWSNGADESQVLLRAGETPGVDSIYRLQLSDNIGCSNEDSIRIRTISSIDSIARSIQDVSICQGADGNIQIEPLNGSPPFRYAWSGTNGSIGDSIVVESGPFQISNLRQGSYRVTISDASSNGCVFKMPPAYINGPDAEVRQINVSPVTCPGTPNGEINLLLTGSPSFSWSTGANTQNINNLEGGYYSVTVTEGVCETILDSIFVAEPEPLHLRFSEQFPSCSDAMDGQIEALAFGGTPPYQFSWEQGSSTSQINNIAQGLYRLTVSDAAGCQQVDSFRLAAPLPLQITLDSSRMLSCFGGADGFLKISIQGGTAPYKTRWNNQSPLNSINNLSAGLYRVVVEDANGCTANANYFVTQPLRINLSVVNQRAPICVGDTSGFIQVQANGGSGNFSYQWDHGASDAQLNSLGIGSFQVVATDENACLSDTVSITLDAVSNLSYTLQATNPTCVGRSDGLIQVTPAGAQEFSYQWSNGDSTASNNNLVAGTYFVTLTDAEGCQADTSISVINAGQPLSAMFNIIEPRCANNSDGLINVNLINAENQPLQYKWSDGPLIRDRQNITAGDYQVTITDNIGCLFVSDTLRVNSPDELSLQLVSKGLIQCQGEENGFLEVAVDGGIKPYTYNWVGTNATSNAAYNLGAGSYQVFTEDANGCPVTASYSLQEPPLLSANLNLEVGNICQGDTSNELSLRVQGGVAPYEYIWNTGQTAATLNNLPPGDYGVIVRDANQCQEVTRSVKVRDPGKPLALVEFTAEDISCFGERDGKLTTNISGGTAPYTYIFSNASIIETFSTHVEVPNLAADNDYRVTIADDKGCIIFSGNQEIKEPSLLNIRRDSIKDIRCAGQADGQIFITPSGGTEPYAYSWINERNEEVYTLQDLNFAPAGTYQVIIGDSEACLDTLRPSTILDRQTPLLVSDTIISAQSCLDKSDGSIRLDISGGSAPYRYQWSNGLSTPQIDRLDAGSYQVTITDQLACKLFLDELVIDSAKSTIDAIETILAVDCAENENGKIQVDLEGGVLPYQISWEAQGNIIALDTTQLDGLPGGNYTLRVMDSTGCSKVFDYQVFEPLALGLQIQARPPSDTAQDGQIQVVVTGGNPPYQYLWNTGDTIPQLDSLGSGVFEIMVSDYKNCLLEESINLLNTRVLNPSIIQTVNLFPNPTQGSIHIQFNLNRPVGLNMVLLNSNGQLLKQWPKQVRASGAHALQLDLPQLSNGSYWLGMFEQGKMLSIHQVVIQN